MKLEGDAAHRVAQERARRQWSLRVAAERANVSVGTWRRVEGSEDVHYQSLVAVCGALGWTVAEVDQLARGELPDSATATPAADEPTVQTAMHGADLTPDEQAKVDAFVLGLLANRPDQG